MLLERVAVAGHLAEAPGEPERTDDCRHYTGAEYAGTEHEPPGADAEIGGKRLTHVADRMQCDALAAQGGGAGDQHRGHHKLSDHRADGRVGSCYRVMFRRKFLVGDC